MNAKSESVVFGVLQDELDRNRRMQSRYRQEIDQLPKGSLYLRKINHQQYYYLNYREKNKVVAKYLGKQDEPKIEDMKKSIAERKRYDDLLKKLIREEKMLMKVMR
jgi:hypothetical protein